MYEDEKVLENLYRANRDVPWEQRAWKVSYERVKHASATLAFERCVQEVQHNERRWGWSDEGMHDVKLPGEAEKFGPVPWGVEVWVYRKFNFLLEEAYQAALETVSFKFQGSFGGMSDTVPGSHGSIPGRGGALANGHYALFWYSRPAVEHQSTYHDRLLGGVFPGGLYRGLHRS